MLLSSGDCFSRILPQSFFHRVERRNAICRKIQVMEKGMQNKEGPSCAQTYRPIFEIYGMMQLVEGTAE